jgi:uncharacterized membrane protein affecting hemolysin expression
MTEYVCSLSGVEAEDDELLDDGEDALGDMPLGWTRVTFQRRLMNPRWEEIQQAKFALVQMALSQVPEEAREQAAPAVAIQIDAQFAALESTTDKYVIFDEVIYIAPPELDRTLAAEFYSVRDRLGLPVPTETESDDEEK